MTPTPSDLLLPTSAATASFWTTMCCPRCRGMRVMQKPCAARCCFNKQPCERCGGTGTVVRVEVPDSPYSRKTGTIH